MINLKTKEVIVSESSPIKPTGPHYTTETQSASSHPSADWIPSSKISEAFEKFVEQFEDKESTTFKMLEHNPIQITFVRFKAGYYDINPHDNIVLNFFKKTANALYGLYRTTDLFEGFITEHPTRITKDTDFTYKQTSEAEKLAILSVLTVRYPSKPEKPEWHLDKVAESKHGLEGTEIAYVDLAKRCIKIKSILGSSLRIQPVSRRQPSSYSISKK